MCNINEYIRNHAIINIGMPPNGYICYETIVDDPYAFIPIIRENNCYIEEITWWHRTEISHGSSIGYGGPRDPVFPDTFFFAETDIFKKFGSLMEDEKYYRYFEQIKKDYCSFELYPAFVVRRRTEMCLDTDGKI